MDDPRCFWARDTGVSGLPVESTSSLGFVVLLFSSLSMDCLFLFSRVPQERTPNKTVDLRITEEILDLSLLPADEKEHTVVSE